MSFIFTEDNYCNATRHLGRAFFDCFEDLHVEVHGKQNTSRSNRYLHSWRFVENNPELPYLVHDTVAVANLFNLNTECSNTVVDDAEYIIQIEDECAQFQTSQDQLHVHRLMEFSFSVTYNHVWSVPVLHFRSQDLDGSMISRSRLLEFIKQGCYVTGNPDATIDGDENFISENEHPITGIPCFFLHPCKTSTRLHALSLSIQENFHESTTHDIRFHSLLLLSWLGMVLPAINFRISPCSYNHLLQKIKRLPISD